MSGKLVYGFGGGRADGDASMKDLLGGKGANLAEMARLGMPVPAGFTITTDVCTHYYKRGRTYPGGLESAVAKALTAVEKEMGMRFGDPERPLLISIRSGARRSMPGMMETVLNVGLCSRTIPGLIKLTGNPRFVWDAYRRLIMMYSDVVMEKAAGVEPAEGQGIRQQLDRMLAQEKRERGCRSDADLPAESLERLAGRVRARVKEVLGREFPDDPREQLWGGVGAVFASWNGRRAVEYRRIERIPEEWGTAVNVQAMVFGNMGASSATGVAFTRDPATGEDQFYGEWLPNAQGEDVVAGIRTPNPLNEATKSEKNRELPSLQKAMPGVYRELADIRTRLERHFHDMQDIEFTIQDGRLWMLQCRVGKRTGPAAVRMALDMLGQGLIDEREALVRVTPSQLDELLHPILDPAVEKASKALAKGLPAGPGGACGQVVFTAADAVAWTKRKQRVILVREETNPEDVEGMWNAAGVLTARGGMTSHAALVARGWGKCCIVGCDALEIDVKARTLRIGETAIREGEWLSLNGTRGVVYAGEVPMVDPTADPRLSDLIGRFLALADRYRRLRVRTNADTPSDAQKARVFGAEGIGLFRTEHMFYGKNSEQPLFLLRKMIVSRTEKERRAALDELFPFVKKDIKQTMAAMDGLPVTVRLLDPPLHEFVPNRPEERARLAEALGITGEELDRRAAELHETNPMMGHRGVRLGVTYPEITEMQVRAILEAAAELIAEGRRALPEIMVPVVGTVAELDNQRAIVDRVHDEVCARYGTRRIEFLYGTMIEVPRAAVTADRIAHTAEFFSFGTNDLTQMSFGFSRDDIGAFVPDYVEAKLLPADPFQILDQEGVGKLIEMACRLGREANPRLHLGICGEHGGEPSSIAFCHRVGLDYVSCSPFRVPIARLAAAHVAIAEGNATARKPARKGARSAAKAPRPARKAAAKSPRGRPAKAARKPAAARAAAPKGRTALKRSPGRAKKRATKPGSAAKPKRKAR